MKRFHEVMDDDFNTPEALAVLQILTREINTARDAKKPAVAASLGAELRISGRSAGHCAGADGRVVPQLQHGQQDCGCRWRHQALPARRVPLRAAWPVPPPCLDQRSPTPTSSASSTPAPPRAVAKNWAESDRLRDELAAADVIVEDKPGGKATWRRK